jgi:hypothetical protein
MNWNLGTILENMSLLLLLSVVLTHVTTFRPKTVEAQATCS